MATKILVSGQEQEIEALNLFPADEGEINQIYGRIGSGKTYAATVDVIKALKRGQVIYANWRIKWDGYDERKNKFLLVLGILGLKRIFYNFPKENLHFFEVKDTFTEDISQLTDCTIYLDEGHIAFDSYEMARMKIEKRSAVLHTRHFDRSIVIISQRPSAIHITLRANVNRFYKCEKISDFRLFFMDRFRIQRFLKSEFQDTTQNDTPDETKIKKLNESTHMLEDTDEYQYVVSQRIYWGKKKVFEAYDTKYMRVNTPTSQRNLAQAFFLAWKERLDNLRA